MVRAFAPKGSRVVDEFSLDPGKTRYYKLPEGTLEIITSSATAAEGAESSFVIGDQTERWKPANGGLDLAATLADNLAKSGARMVETPNAWVPGTESVAEGSWDAWLAQEEGRTVDERSILYDAKMAPAGTDMNDPESLRASLEFVYDDCEWKKDRPGGPADVRPIMKRIWSLTARPDDSRRKYLNWPSVAVDAWLDAAKEWAPLIDRSRVVEDGEEVVLFFDGSKSGDSTALVGCCMSDGHVFVVDVWEPSRGGGVVPVAEVDLAVRDSAARWKVLGFFGDVKEWESFVKLDWPEAFGDLVVQAEGGKDPQAVAWDMRSHVFDFTRAVELVEAEILERAFTHDGDPRLGRHIGNCRRRPNRWGLSIGKESPGSAKKIDAAVCMVGARMVRRLVLAVQPKRKRTGRVWV